LFPDYPAPAIRKTGTSTEMMTTRWGMPPPPHTGGPPVMVRRAEKKDRAAT
jgi:hypothetical protein